MKHQLNPRHPYLFLGTMKKCLLHLALLLTSSIAVYAQEITRQVRPSDTDASISTFNTDSHYVYLRPDVSSKNALLVHLPGSFGEPKRATRFGRHAATLGFHSIGLMYPNVPTVGSFCTNNNAVNCFEEVRREIVEGQNYSLEINIAPQESILSRLRMLLIYLNTNFPTENWGQFLDENNQIRYEKLLFSGHSQGGGHAALIAKYFPIQRALCFSAPKDWRNPTNAPPLWLSQGSWQTPPAQIYAFNHELDEHIPQQLTIWDSLGLNSLGAPVNVDASAPPFAQTRQLTTNVAVPAGDDHASTIQDNKTPLVNGIPVFEPVWTYMLTGNTLVTHQQTLLSADFKLIENPNSGKFVIELNQPDNELKIIDLSGKIIHTRTLDRGSHNLHFPELKPGVYSIMVRNAMGMSAQRMMIR